MLPTTADQATAHRYAERIMRTWDAATPAGRDAGRAWYPAAHDLAAEIGRGDARAGAGILAALSQCSPWPRTVSLARDAGRGTVHGHTGAVLAKVRAILAGADPAALLPAELKTGHFYRNIANPADPAAVTVDRHAHDIAAGERYGRRNRGLTSPARYATLAGAYRTAAAELGELPSTVQAVTWLHWRQAPA